MDATSKCSVHIYFEVFVIFLMGIALNGCYFLFDDNPASNIHVLWNFASAFFFKHRYEFRENMFHEKILVILFPFSKKRKHYSITECTVRAHL